MKITILEPKGFCMGVERAYRIALKTKESYPSSNVYCLSPLVHNENVTRDLEKKSIGVLGKESQCQQSLTSASENDAIVFSAHGHPKDWEDLAPKAKLIDATCPFVLANCLLGQRQCDNFIYLGLPKHLETIAFLSNCPKAVLFDVDSQKLSIGDLAKKPNVICQTTLSQEDIDKSIQAIQTLGYAPNLIATSCKATKERQSSIKSLPKDVDLLLVLGSKASNNAKKLFQIGREKGIETILVSSKEEFGSIPAKNKKHIAIASSASTPSSDVDMCFDYLKSLL